MNWQSLIGEKPDGSPILYEGRILDDAATLTDMVRVSVAAFDKNLEWGPAPWMPRVDTAGDPELPQQGDRCIVALAETEDPGTPEVWIIGWWSN